MALLASHRVCYLALLLATLSCLATLLSLQHFVVDDSYIPLRYVAHWLDGDGLVWNPGERVEGYTSFLMLPLTAALHLLGLPMLAAARFIQLLSLAAMCACMLRSIKHWCKPPLRLPLQATALILLLTSLPILYWAMSGLETVLFTCLTLAAILSTLACLESDRRPAFTTGILFALSMLARPEGALFTALAGLTLLLHHPRTALHALLPIAVIIGTHLLWRHSYYGEWLPNTFYAKLGGPLTATRLRYGLHYIAPLFFALPFLGLYVVPLFLTALRPGPYRTGNRMLLAMLLSYLAYLIFIGGDWMPMHRFLVPAIALLVLMLVRALASLRGGETDAAIQTTAQHAPSAGLPRRFAPRNNVWAMLPLLALLLGGMQALRAHEPPYPKYPLYLEAIAAHMTQHFPPGSLVAINMAGIIPYHTPQLRYLDMLGLNDRTIAHRIMPPHEGRFDPGHEKGDGAYLLARRPDYLILGDAMSETSTIDHPIYASERELSVLPNFHRLYRLKRTTIPLHHPDLATETMVFTYYERVK